MHSCLRKNSFGADLTWRFSRVVLFGGTHNRLGSIISASLNKATLTVQPTQRKKDGHLPQSSLAVHPVGSQIGKAIDGESVHPQDTGLRGVVRPRTNTPLVPPSPGIHGKGRGIVRRGPGTEIQLPLERAAPRGEGAPGSVGSASRPLRKGRRGGGRRGASKRDAVARAVGAAGRGPGGSRQYRAGRSWLATNAITCAAPPLAPTSPARRALHS